MPNGMRAGEKEGMLKCQQSFWAVAPGSEGERGAFGTCGEQAGVRSPCWVFKTSAIGEQAWVAGNRDSKGVSCYKVT